MIMNIYTGQSQPGVGPHDTPGDTEPVYHSYYQWVGMALFVQSMSFYVPHLIWKSCEGRRVERLVSGVLSPTVRQVLGYNRDKISSLFNKFKFL